MPHNVCRNGKVHVCRKLCSTCVFRLGNLMMLEPDGLAQMVEDAIESDSTIICHGTLDGDNDACRGFFDRHETTPLIVAKALGLLVEVDPP